MKNKISTLGVKKIILILIFGFFLFWWNVFAWWEVNNSTYITSGWVKKTLTTEQQNDAKAQSAAERGGLADSYTEKVIDNTKVYENNKTWEEKLSIPDWSINSELNTKVDTPLTDSYTKSQLDWISTDWDLEDYTSRQLKRGETSWWETNQSSSEWIQVNVTEKIPGANCDWSDWDYTCTVKPGFKTVMWLMWWIIKYFTYLAALGWVLFIVINWIMLSMWGMWWWSKDEIKKKITMTIWWLILLLLSGLILNAIAPWIYK